MKPISMLQILSGIVIAIAGSLAAAETQADPLDALGAYDGAWRVTTREVQGDRQYGPAHQSVLVNSCHRFVGFYGCEQQVDGEQKALVVFAYDEATRNYRSFPIAVGARQAGSGVLQIRGLTWTFPWSTSENDSTMFYRVVNIFTSPTHIDYRKEKSVDEKHWIILEVGNEDKIG